jgi:Mg-chelatase subunit ChlD
LLPEGFELVSGSDHPPSKAIKSDAATHLIWNWAQKDLNLSQPLTITYQLQPVKAGEWNIESDLTLTDNRLRQTPTPLPTDTPPPTPTPKPAPLYLPILLRESCADQWVFADVALVVDVSESMRELTVGGRTKLAATQAAAKTFLGLMQLAPNGQGQHDQVAVVGFNHDAWVEQALTNDASFVATAIDRLALRQANGTRLDLAFDRGAEALTGPSHRAANHEVLVLLTDGQPTGVPLASDRTVETTVKDAAGRAKAAGVAVYTIGVGGEGTTNPALLRACASSPAQYFDAPDAEELGRIYAGVAYRVGCPAERFWGRR